ncbi:lytic polysaccharide monooxygenase auxiliary activity family 9 protein [Streptomyces sp. NPDC004838]
MTAHRRTAVAVALAGVVPVALTALGTGVARAHGAPTDPVSRVAACGPEGTQRGSTACRSAVAANGGLAFDAWDDLRVADVRGRDREVIPDGELCSAGLPAYRGLDTARADWPSTPLKAGGVFALTYRATIPHQGTFSLYLTKQGYDPAIPLRWSDLEAEPFASASDPEPRDGAYRITGRLPTGLTGRHVLYTIWRNTDTPDTYYSCSDVTLSGAVASSPGGDPTPGAVAPVPDGTATAPVSPAPVQPGQEPVRPVRTQAVADGGDDTIMLIGGSAAALVLLALAASAALRRGRR